MKKVEHPVICLCWVLFIALISGCTEPSSPPQGPDVVSTFKMGKNYFDKAMYDEAIAEFNKVLDIVPSHVDALLYRGESLLNKKQYDKAVDDFNSAVELAPDNAEAYGNRGIAYNAVGQKKQALADYSRAIDINPEYFAAYANRGNLFLNSRLYDNAVSDYTKVIELNPSYAQAYNNRGSAYKAKRAYKEAVADYSKAVELSPGFAVAYINRGNLFRDAGQYDRALADYDRAVSIDKGNAETLQEQANSFFQKGVALIKKGDAKGIKMIERAAFLQSTNPVYRLNYGSALALLAKSMNAKGKEGTKEAIINAYRKAAAEWEIALLLFDRQGNNRKDYVKCLFQLADLYEFVFKRTDKAAALYKKILQIQPGHSLSEKALKRLRTGK